MTRALDAAMTGYFAAEKRGAAVFLALGLAAVAAAILLWRSATPYHGMAPPLGGVGLVQLAAGAGVLLRTGRRLAGLREGLALDPSACRQAELARMRRVAASFRLYKAIEMAVLTAGLTLVMLFPRHHPLYAAGLGGMLQGSLTLILDRLAERRADGYVRDLRQA